MFNFFINNPQDINGSVNRYKDFSNYCKDNNIICNFNKDRNDNTNIIDIDYYIYDDKTIEHGSFFFGGFRNYYNVKITRPIFVHNLMYATLCKGVFFPMFMYKNRYNVDNNSKKKYEWGCFTSFFDGNYPSIIETLKLFGMTKENTLLLDREQTVKKFDTTTNTEYFLNSVEKIVDISTEYSTRHVFSRFIGECILVDKPIYYMILDNYMPNSFAKFKHIVYEPILKKDNFVLTKLNYDKKYFLLNNYSKYIKYLEENNNSNIIYYDNVEEYSNLRS